MVKIRYTGNAPEKEITQVYNETMSEMFEEDSNVVYLDADLMGSLKTKELWKKYPHNVFNTGIQEANMIGVACGMYLAGYKPYVHSFSPFASRRVFDQVFISGAYAKKRIKIIGSDAGIAATYNGGTHMCFEDIAMFRAVPNACIVDVSDGVMFSKLLRLVKDYPGIVYLRTARRGVPDIYNLNEEFEIGKGKILHEGTDATVVASGLQVQMALKAALELEKENISVRVIDPITVKPLDKDLIIESAKKTGLIITSENGNINGGLGDAVASVVAENCPIYVLKNGVQDQFGQVGNEQYLREQYHLRSEDIIALVKEGLAKKK
ncbi:MAG: transketolase family protein [Roseburia inulinivorans]